MDGINLASAYTGPALQIQQLAESQARTQNSALEGQKLGLEIKTQQMALEDEQKFRQIMSERMARAGTPAQPGQPARSGTDVIGSQRGNDLSTPVDAARQQIDDSLSLVNELAGKGLYNRANDLFSKTMTNMSHLATAQSGWANSRLKGIEAQEKMATDVHRLAVGIKDQPSFDNAKMQYLSEHPGEPIPMWFNLPYNTVKPLIEQIKNSSKEGMDAAKTQSEIVRNRAAASEQTSLKNLHDVQTKIEQLELDHQQEQADLAKKNGQPLPPVKHEKMGAADDKVSANERMNAQQLIMAANQVYTGFDEIMKLKPGTTMGTFADVAYTKNPEFIGEVKKWLANKITADEEHMYASRLAGVNVAMATIASGGRAPRVSQMEAEKEALAALKGQSRSVFFDKINQALLKAGRDLEVVRPGTKEQKSNLEMVAARLKTLQEQVQEARKNLSKGGRSAEGKVGGEVKATYETMDEAQAAADRGDLKPGTRIKIGNQEGTWQ